MQFRFFFFFFLLPPFLFYLFYFFLFFFRALSRTFEIRGFIVRTVLKSLYSLSTIYSVSARWGCAIFPLLFFLSLSLFFFLFF